MKEQWNKFKELIFGRELELRERTFRIISLVGSVLAVFGLIESMPLLDEKTFVVAIFVLLVVFGAAFLATFKYRRVDLASMILGVLIIVIIFPIMFFLNGGLESGATVWFSLGLLYVFMMFNGKRMVFFIFLSILVDIATYIYGYQHPEVIVPLDSTGAEYLDSLFSVLAVGFAGGVMIKVQMKLFSIESAIARKQQEELERVSASKNSFFASMSHEIRTPINTIVGLNEMILRESNENVTREYAHSIQSASKMLLSLVNDILDLSQLEMKKMEIVPTQYKTTELFGNLIDMIYVRLKEKKIELQLDIDENIPSVLWGDMKRIHQVILNILTNAAKYTEKGSVTFSAHVESKEEGDVRLRITVEDTGIGIRKEDLEYIYDSFQRVDIRKNQKVEGSGLGLAITKQLVDMMEGEITVDSIYMKGSTFTVILPQKIVDETPIGDIRFLSRSLDEEERYNRSFEAPEARVLIVDDNYMNSMVEQKLLQETKVQVDVARTGKECLEMTKRKYYHVILMDYMMPEMDGIQTLKQLRRQENGLCRDSAVVVLSANSAAESGANYLEDGFDGYLEKPIQGAALEAEILKFLPEDIIEYRMQPGESDKEAEITKVSHKKKKKVYITTDCVSDLTGDMLEKYDIGVIYVYIRTKTGRFVDTLEISSDSINQYVTDMNSNAVTESVSVNECEEFFAEALGHAEQVIHISMAKNVGESYSTAVTAAQCFDHVRVIDSGQISCGQALVVLYAGQMALEGYTADQICDRIEKIKKQVLSHYIMPSANLFYQRGRLGKLMGRMCMLFKLHPTMKMVQSDTAIVGVMGGRLENAWKRFIHHHLVKRRRKIHKGIVYICHAGCSVEQQEMIRREILKWVPFEKVVIQRTSASIACNSGIGTFGLGYYINIKEEEWYKSS
ncbi:MAG: DegV family EDD domain-containing protein [Lachnospiraceae bacterium]|nr:DegV family EDD domain-containing protein [Lachnospiraceae bacterium]